MEESILQTLKTETGIILSIPVSSVSPDVPLAELGYDSMSFVELMIAVEKKYKVRLFDAGLTAEDTRSLKSVASCIERLL